MTEEQYDKLMEDVSSAPNFDGGSIKEYPGNGEVAVTTNTHDMNGEPQFGKPTPTDKVAKDLAIQNFWLSIMNQGYNTQHVKESYDYNAQANQVLSRKKLYLRADNVDERWYVVIVGVNVKNIKEALILTKDKDGAEGSILIYNKDIDVLDGVVNNAIYKVPEKNINMKVFIEPTVIMYNFLNAWRDSIEEQGGDIDVLGECIKQMNKKLIF